MDALLDAVRTKCLPGLWSQGVSLARGGKVVVVGARSNETTVRVAAPGQAIAPTVVLYPEDREWSCDCGSKIDPCAHVAAAAIAMSQGAAAQAQSAAPDAAASSTKIPSIQGKIDAGPQLRYDLSRCDGMLFLERVVAQRDGSFAPLSDMLATLVARKRCPVLPTHDDLAIDRLIASWGSAAKAPSARGSRGEASEMIVPPGRIAELFGRLANTDVTFEGHPARVTAEPLLPHAFVRDHKAGGVALRIERDPAIDEVISRGAARIGFTLHPLGETQTSGAALERLPLERVFSPAELGELVTRVLPEIEKKLPVHLRTKRLPTPKKHLLPRISMVLSQHDHALSVLPLLVYGDPAVARIDDGVLTQLGREVPERRPHLERALVERLRDELHLVPGRRVDLDGSDAARFVDRLKRWRGDVRDETLGEVFGRRELVPRFAMEGDRFDLMFDVVTEEGDNGETRIGSGRASAEAVLRAWREGLGIVPLDDGGWAPLPANWLSRFGERVADLLAAKDDEGHVSPAALPQLAGLCDDLELPRPPSIEKLRPLLTHFEGLPQMALPPDLTATLRPYQTSGVNWLSFLRSVDLGGILADDMGLGKTLQTLCVVRGRTLVICPASVLFNWEAEIRKFRPSLTSALYHGPDRKLDPNIKVTITTYALLRVDAQRLSEVVWDTIVLDEAQTIKNPDSQTARAAFGLKGAFRVALSGTPVENRLEELWSQMHFVNRGLLGPKSDFKARYEEPISRGEPGAAKRLRDRIASVVLRRMKRDVAPELPPRTELVRSVALDDAERAVYDAVRAATKKDLVARLGEGYNVLAALEALLRLRQAACHASLVPGQQAKISSKVTALLELVEDAAADGHKILVFSQWTSFLDLIEPHLQEAQIPFTRLDGSTRDRGAVVEAFQSDSGPPVMLLSLKAGGTGLNLTAADHVVLMDPWWNPAVEDQAADRAHRIGQDKPVLVYRMVAKDTVEERILALQTQKRAVADAALGGADRAAAITREELMALLD